MKKIKTDKTLSKKEMDKINDHIFRVHYLCPKKREEMKNLWLEIKKRLDVEWSLKDDPFLYSEKDRLNLIDWTFITTKALSLIKKGEDWSRIHTLRDRKFFFYQHKTKPLILIEAIFYKVIEKKHKVVNLIIPKVSFENGTLCKANFMREKLPKDNWELLDKGTFSERLIDPKGLMYIYRGKHLRFKLKLKVRGKTQDNFWLHRVQEKMETTQELK